jgi:hypothetical protein
MLQIRQNDRTAFSVHNEMMKQFRRSHGKVVTSPPAAAKEQDFIPRTLPIVAKHIRLDNGGTYREALTINWFICPLLPKIAGYKLSSN